MRNFLKLAPLLILVSSQLAWAKKVSVEWKPIKGAVSYEIQIKKDGKVVAKKEADENNWSGDLDFGLYTYQIRAIDKVGRPGKWTKVHALVAMPKSAENLFPKDSENLTTYHSSDEVSFKWSPSEAKSDSKESRYRLVVRNAAGKAVIDEVITGLSSEKKKLPPGKYEWQVTQVVEARNLASLEGKKWEGKASEKSEFSVEKLPLVAPELIFPKGSLRPRENGKIQFRWEAVPGAEAYEVHFLSHDASGDPKNEKDRKWITTKLSSTMPLATEGSYRWKVRALASLDSKQIPQEVGAESNTEFSLDRNAGFLEDKGRLSLSTIYTSYNYQADSPSRGVVNGPGVNSAATGINLVGEYWVKPQFGLGLNFLDTFFSINSMSLDQKDIELDLKYRTSFSSGWSLFSHLGFLSRDYVILYPQYSFNPGTNSSYVSGTNHDSFNSIGPATGVELKKQFTDNFSVSAKLNYYLPMGGGVLRGSESNRNYGVGIEATEWFSKRWAYGGGFYTQNRSVSRSNSGNNGTTIDTVSMDGQSFYGTLTYSFGR
jgi:hypothetical protein